MQLYKDWLLHVVGPCNIDIPDFCGNILHDLGKESREGDPSNGPCNVFIMTGLM